MLAILVRVPGTTRPWALPVLIDLYRNAADNQARRRPQRTPAQLMCPLLRLLLQRFPTRTFVFVVDAGYGTHEVARFCHRHRPRLAVVSKLHPAVNLFTPPPPARGPGRPRSKGERLHKPQEAVAARQGFHRLTVAWYDGGTRQVQTLTATGHWYKSGQGLAPVCWVFVRDRTGTHRDEYFFTTDPTLTPTAHIGLYTGRWNLETTFQELRSNVGLETTQGCCQRTVVRAAPCLFGLYTVVAVLYHQLSPQQRRSCLTWPGKVGITFSDALAAVRRWLWADWVLPETLGEGTLEKLTPPAKPLTFSSNASGLTASVELSFGTDPSIRHVVVLIE